jgi:hypothetical protein
MNRIIQVLLFTCFSTYCLGQTVALAQLRFKTLYSDFNNPVEIAVSNYSCKDIVVTAQYSKISKVDSCKYLIKPPNILKETIYISTISNKDTVLIDTINYTVKRFPMPTASLANTGQGKGIPFPNKIIASIKDFDYDVSFTVISFNMSLFSKDSKVDSLSVEGNVIDKKAETIIKKGLQGDRCYIDSIHVQREDGEIQEINGIFIKF